MEILATIELGADAGRGEVFLEIDDGAYIVAVQTEAGVEYPAIAPQHSAEEAKQAIELSWGRGPWDLQWL